MSRARVESEPPPSSEPSSEGGEGLRERKKRDKRDRLRAAAWELFLDRGYDATTTRAIAERAGVATGTLFLYAKDKADLLFLVFEHRLGEAVTEGLATVPAGAPLVDQLMHLFSGLFTMYGEAPEIGQLFIKEFPGAAGPNAERVHAITFRFLASVAELVQAAQERGELRRDFEPLLASQTMFSIYFMALMGWLTGMIPVDYARDGQLRPALELLVQGLAAR
jgi:AcrR family transcriptional regulator